MRGSKRRRHGGERTACADRRRVGFLRRSGHRPRHRDDGGTGCEDLSRGDGGHRADAQFGPCHRDDDAGASRGADAGGARCQPGFLHQDRHAGKCRGDRRRCRGVAPSPAAARRA